MIAVAGDVGQDGLGLDVEGRRLLAASDVVVHSAATVSFDAPLDQAVEVNLLGPSRVAAAMVEACRDRGSALPHFISVSTATWPAPTRGRPGRGCSTRTRSRSTSSGRPRWRRPTRPRRSAGQARRGTLPPEGILASGPRGARRSRRPPAGRPLGAPARGVGQGRDGPRGLGTRPIARLAGRLPLYQGPRRACTGQPPRPGYAPPADVVPLTIVRPSIIESSLARAPPRVDPGLSDGRADHHLLRPRATCGSSRAYPRAWSTSSR